MFPIGAKHVLMYTVLYSTLGWEVDGCEGCEDGIRVLVAGRFHLDGWMYRNW